MGAKSLSLLVALLLTFLKISTSTSTTAVPPNGTPPTHLLTPMETLAMDALNLGAEEVHSASHFLSSLSGIQIVREQSTPSVRDCLDHLSEQVHRMHLDLVRMMDIRNPKIQDSALGVRDRAGKIRELQGTCKAAVVLMDGNIANMLQTSVANLASNIADVVTIVMRANTAEPSP